MYKVFKVDVTYGRRYPINNKVFVHATGIGEAAQKFKDEEARLGHPQYSHFDISESNIHEEVAQLINREVTVSGIPDIFEPELNFDMGLPETIVEAVCDILLNGHKIYEHSGDERNDSGL